jgi:curved DNA-binding protein CbpA
MYLPHSSELKPTSGDLTKAELKQRYHSLIKKYHSDNCQHDESKLKVYEEITKIIIKAYHELDKRVVDGKPAAGEKSDKEGETSSEEDVICMELFGKKYADAKYWMYEPGNEEAKKAFFEQLQRRQSSKSSATSSTSSASSRESSFQ